MHCVKDSEVHMCLSAEVDLVAGLVITAAGVDAICHAEDRRDYAIAGLPVGLGHTNWWRRSLGGGCKGG